MDKQITRTQLDRWLCEKCGEVRSSPHEENMCAKVAELKDQTAQLRGALQRCASYVGGNVDATASHLFHVMVADEVSSVVERLNKRSRAAMYEDQLPEMSDEQYREWFSKSWLEDGVRVGPKVVISKESRGVR